MRHQQFFSKWLATAVAACGLLGLACGTAATPSPAPTATGAPAATQPGGATAAPTATAPAGAPTPTRTTIPTPAATATPLPTGIVSALDSAVLVINQEPLTMNPFPTQGGIGASPGKDNTVDPFTWQSGDDLRIVPTTATTGWEQLGSNKWRFMLRQGVKFHNGEPWNAQAAIPSLDYQRVGNNENISFVYTAGYSVEAVDDYTLDFTCDQDCPLLPRTMFFLNFLEPEFYQNASEADLNNNVVSFGPYKLVDWQRGVELNQEAYEDYVPAGDHFEFQKPYIKNLKWVWRSEPTVMSSMVRTGEADLAWDVGVDEVEALPEDMIISGGSAEVLVFWMNTMWHPELKKVKVRQAISHAIDCQELVDSLYGGHTTCRGNVIWPGVIGATEENTKPYKYDPELAKQLLQEAGYDPKNTVKITGRGDRIPKQVEVFEAMQAYMKVVGINAEVNVVDAQVRNDMRNCAIGKAVNEVLEGSGRDPSKDEATLADMQAALDKGGSNCPTADMLESPLSNEPLDFGLTANRYLNCIRITSFFCDPSPGGIQEQLPKALGAQGEERQRLMQAMADRVHNEVIMLGMFDTPVFYAKDPKLEFSPRFDRRVRANTLWFRP